MVKLGRYANWRSRMSVKYLHRNVGGSNPSRPTILKNRRLERMNFRELVIDIKKEIGVRSLITGKLGSRESDVPLVLCYRPMKDRGRDQTLCILAHIKSWIKTGTTESYCLQCRHFLKMTCMESSGFSEECRKGHYRFEAT